MTSALPAGRETAADPLAALVLGWLAGQRSVHTRRAYGRDIAGWLAWCAGYGIEPLFAIRPDAGGWRPRAWPPRPLPASSPPHHPGMTGC